MHNEFERVVLTEDLPELGLMRGDVGVIVMVHQDGKGYEVEFLTLAGETVAVETLRAQQIRNVQEGELTHVRKWDEAA
jgi:glutamine phosphoribosylpyrophosphate amidotransferase